MIQQVVEEFYNSLKKCEGDNCIHNVDGKCSYTKNMVNDICIKDLYIKFTKERKEKEKIKSILKSLESKLSVIGLKVEKHSLKIESTINSF